MIFDIFNRVYEREWELKRERIQNNMHCHHCHTFLDLLRGGCALCIQQ